MASISTDKTGNKLIQFADPIIKTRRTLRLGKMTKREAESFKAKLERLVFSKIAGTVPEPEVAAWVAALDSAIADKLTEWGLINPKMRTESFLLGAFLDSYFTRRHDVKAATQTVYRRVRRHLVAFFGESKPIADITAGDADDWKLYLVREGLAENTARRHIGFARQFFRVAVRHKYIAENPFADLKAAVKGNPERFHFLTARDASKVIDACPDDEYRLIVALARFGGLRTPSETFALKWSHVDWENGRITVPSPKTEHHKGHESRLIPLFPELRPHLEKLFFKPDEQPSEFVITSYRDAKKNLRTRFERIIQRAGLKPWPKLFQNLRSSRETELLERFPIQVVVAWLGNSESVAKKHYLQVTDEHYAAATYGEKDALQKALQQPAETQENAMKTESDEITELSSLQELAVVFSILQRCIVDAAGLEPATPTMSSNSIWPAKQRQTLVFSKCNRSRQHFKVIRRFSGFFDVFR